MKEQIGYFYSNGNNVSEFSQNTSILSSTYASLHGIPVYKENLRKILSLFIVRSVSKHIWMNDCDVCIGKENE